MLDGGVGIDTMVGGAGNDVYLVDSIVWPHGLQFTGGPGEYVSGGQAHSYSGAGGIFSVTYLSDFTGDGLIDYLRLYYEDGEHWWGVTFSSVTAGVGPNLAAGVYLDSDPGGINIFGDGRGAGSSYGEFTIHGIEVDYSGASPVLRSFAADFEFQAESPTAPLLTGSVTYDVTGAWGIEPVIEAPDEGLDTNRSSVSAVLPDHVATLVLTSVGHLDGSGNGLNNILSGNAGNNVLDGAAGADIIAGGPGNDTYVVDNSGDQVMELGNSGTDAVQSGVSYDLMQA